MQTPFASTTRRYRGAGVCSLEIWESIAKVHVKMAYDMTLGLQQD
jgi:hypothetical protein